MTLKNIFQAHIYFAMLLLPVGAKAQDTCVYLFTIAQKADFATADHLANAYILHGFEVEKYDSTGKFVSRYSNNRLGMPGFLDASNPLKILVWYADFQTAVFLDRNMTELGRLNLTQAGFPAVRCLASAADGNIWAYDEATSHLLKLSTSGEKLIESQPLNLEFAQRFAPTSIRDDGGQGVFLSDPAQGVALFDPFAQLDKVLPFKGLAQFEVENGTLFFAAQNEIRAENWRGLSSKKTSLPVAAQPEGAVFWISKKRVFVQSEYGVTVYGF
ncbi:MAG: hypothetical protein H7246_20470 [Phycisphaerae bacterium]|nr:hypothetical protein [Saprospiraceae bacterium]